jgi:hypothetical protein
LYRVGNALGDGAYETIGALRDGQAVQIKQLSQMMRKRQLLSGDPDEMWPHLKAALLYDEQDHIDRGLRPRIVYRGRDLFARAEPAPDEMRSAEAAVAAAMVGMESATHRALRARLCALEPAALERVAHVYLMRTGWTEIEWIKRVHPSSYALGQPVVGVGRVLISVRAGNDPIDRRGVGELRVGVEAKDLATGLLLSPCDLSDVARRELARPGKSISALVGDAFVAALQACGVGVRRKHVPISYLDDGFFRELVDS